MIVGLNGKKGAGKDTVGQILIDKYGFEKLSFAAKLKESAAALWGFDPSVWEQLKNDPHATVEVIGDDGRDVENPYKEPLFRATVSVREFLQRYGTESHRDIFGSNFWVDHATKGINPNKDYVVTDCRFENEIDKIHSLDGVVVRILREDADHEDSHVSEIPPPDHKVDYYLDNNGKIDELDWRVEELFVYLKAGEYND